MVLETFAEFNEIIVCSLFLILCTAISVHICFGYGTKSAKEAMMWSLIILLAAVQLYHLIDAALYVPATKFFIYKNRFHRMDCINSNKGGKRPGNSQLSVDVNPCYCKYGNNCTVASTGREYTFGSCPTHGSDVICVDKNKNTVHAYISKLRNCNGGQGNQCTENEPCYPCELEKLAEFKADRCRACSTDNKGNCNFIPGVGPYCLDRKGSRKVVPCKMCCTEATPLFVDGICY